jgi:hypothetical protein
MLLDISFLNLYKNKIYLNLVRNIKELRIDFVWLRKIAKAKKPNNFLTPGENEKVKFSGKNDRFKKFVTDSKDNQNPLL